MLTLWCMAMGLGLLAGFMALAWTAVPLPGLAELQVCRAAWSSGTEWQARASGLRQRILQGAGLWPWPAKQEMETIWRDAIKREGYVVQPVAFASIPGFYCVGNMYLPAPARGRRPAIVRTHGHGQAGRLSAQQHCADLARSGAVVLAISMVGYNEATQYCGVHSRPAQAEDWREPGPLLFSLQLLNLIRAVDFLQDLPAVDPGNISITGESGGGTQAFMLAAVDARIHVSIPVVMVSASHCGCACERGPAGLVPGVTNHAEIAAMHAPRPLLVVSDGQDWTRHTPAVEMPYLQSVYAALHAPGLVENVHLPEEGHDYGPSKQQAAAQFLRKHGVLESPGEGARDTSPLCDEELQVFGHGKPWPSHALRTAGEIEQRWREIMPSI